MPQRFPWAWAWVYYRHCYFRSRAWEKLIVKHGERYERTRGPRKSCGFETWSVWHTQRTCPYNLLPFRDQMNPFMSVTGLAPGLRAASLGPVVIHSQHALSLDNFRDPPRNHKTSVSTASLSQVSYWLKIFVPSSKNSVTWHRSKRAPTLHCQVPEAFCILLIVDLPESV